MSSVRAGALAASVTTLAATLGAQPATGGTAPAPRPPASATPTPATAPTSAPSAAPAGTTTVEAPEASASATCIERIPEGKQPPKLEESFPTRGTSGHAATLLVVVEHLKGEEVLPGGFRISESTSLQALERSHLVLPDPDGAAAPIVTRSAEQTRTEVKLSVVPLPPEPGRHELTLPPLPITIARANGQVLTLCTKPHPIVVDDPIANEPDPKPKQNPPARRQLEEWELLKQLAIGLLLALLIGPLAAWLVQRWRRRERPAPPPPPPRPPWEVAIEELHDVRHAGLIKAHRFSEHFDRVSDTIRQYLGARYGYDGLESTTREALAVLNALSPPVEPLQEITAFLRQADLVKFARLTPTEEECELALARGEQIVKSTMPRSLASPPPARSSQEDAP